MKQKQEDSIKFLTIEEFHDGIKDISKDISELFYKKFKENDKRWEENNQKLDRIMNTQDTILGKFENWETEETVGTEQIRELRVDVDDHEKRISKLEAKKN